MISKQQYSNVGSDASIRRFGRLAPIFLLTVGLSMPAAAEKNGAEPARPQATSAVDVDYANSGRLRSFSATIAKDQDSALASRPSKSLRRTKSESRMVPSKKKIVKAKIVLPTSAYQQALQALRVRASEVAPTENARVEMSFVVGKQGQPMRPGIVGGSPTLTKALIAQLQDQRFPKEHAGQFYVSKLNIRATAVIAPAKPLKKRWRARKMARRNSK